MSGYRCADDLPAHSVAQALALVDAVRCRSRRAVAEALHRAESHDGLEALAVSLAAMVDDQKTLADLLAWNDRADLDVNAWRNALTEVECRRFHAAFERGIREPSTVDGEREYQKRRARGSRKQSARNLRRAA